MYFIFDEYSRTNVFVKYVSLFKLSLISLHINKVDDKEYSLRYSTKESLINKNIKKCRTSKYTLNRVFSKISDYRTTILSMLSMECAKTRLNVLDVIEKETRFNKFEHTVLYKKDVQIKSSYFNIFDSCFLKRHDVFKNTRLVTTNCVIIQHVENGVKIRATVRPLFMFMAYLRNNSTPVKQLQVFDLEKGYEVSYFVEKIISVESVFSNLNYDFDRNKYRL